MKVCSWIYPQLPDAQGLSWWLGTNMVFGHEEQQERSAVSGMRREVRHLGRLQTVSDKAGAQYEGAGANKALASLTAGADQPAATS